MSVNTILLIILAVIVAAGIAFYQYLYKANYKSKLHLFLAFLRFSTLFLILLLLINPIISRTNYEIQKTPLPIVIDNSSSVAFLNQDQKAKELAEVLISDKNLNEQYEVKRYSFDQDFYSDKALDFKGKQSNIDKVFDNIKQLYRSQNHPIILLSDGNQTQGNDYVYGVQQNATVLPIVLGDTIEHLDLKIAQLNSNKYAFLKNKFPVEVFLNYTGNAAVNANFTIQSGNTTILKQNLSFSPTKKSQSISLLLDADKVGVHIYKASINSSIKEKNKYNNVKSFAVEVIDQRTEIAIVSSIMHPDLGALKRAIETNAQRKVTIVKPKEITDLSKFNVLILYQPGYDFKTILEQNKNLKINTFVVTGLATDFNLLNQYQDNFVFKMSGQKEDFSANFNTNFNAFSIENIGFDQFPPLENPFGTITTKANTTNLLNARIRTVSTDSPLLSFIEKGNSRSAYLFGENIWKWRVDSYLKEKSFDKFDVFLDKTVQFLASNATKKNLIVNHERFYNSGETITILAEYFNKNYEFDENAQLTIQLKNKSTNTVKVYDFLKASADYQVSFQDLEAGNYNFVVKEKSSKAQYSGSFQVLDFDVEKQFVNADLSRLKQVAQNTGGTTYFPSEVQKLIDFLKNNENYKPIQKEVIKKSPLIDWMWGLIWLATLMATEWFTRKYNGLL